MDGQGVPKSYKLIFQLLSNVLLFAAADKIAKLLIILLAKGPLLLHEVMCSSLKSFRKVYSEVSQPLYVMTAF